MAGLVRPNVNQRFDSDDRQKADGRVILGRAPAFYLVVIHKDEMTPPDIVLQILESVFAKPKDEATRIVSLAKCFGICVVSAYPFEIAEAKAEQGRRVAATFGFALRFTVQKEG